MAGRIKELRKGAYRTLAANRVYVDYFEGLQEEDLPAVMVYGQSETSEELDVTLDRRKFKVKIEIQACRDDAMAQIDLIADTIIDLFRDDPYLGGKDNGLSDWMRYTSGELYYDEKRNFNGICWLMEFEVPYLYSVIPNPEYADIAPFETMTATYALGEDNPEPTDTISLPQV